MISGVAMPNTILYRGYNSSAQQASFKSITVAKVIILPHDTLQDALPANDDRPTDRPTHNA